MSSVYFIASDGVSIIALDCEETINVSKKNSVSRSSIMSGAKTSDGYSEGLKTVNVSGLVTYSKSVSQQRAGLPNPMELQDLIDGVIRNHTRFKLYAGKGAHQLLKDINTCVIEGYDITLQDYLDTIQITMTISEVFVSDSATKTYLAPIKSGDASRGLSDTESTKSSKEVVPEEETDSILRNITGFSIFQGGGA